MKKFRYHLSVLLLMSYIEIFTQINDSVENTAQISLCNSTLAQNCLKKIVNPTKTEPLHCIARPFNYNLKSELFDVSTLLCINFVKRPEWSTMPREVIALYIQANTPESLYELMEKSGTRGYVIEDNGVLLGVIILRSNEHNNIVDELQIKRCHTSFATLDYKGVGTALLTIAALDALSNNIPSIITTASMPARGFFEKMKWEGNVIESHYSVFGQSIVLPQFKTAYQIPTDFQGF